MFTIGGGYAMIPLIEREVVNRGWLDKQDFMDLFAMTQSLPGIFAVNISIFVGYKLKKEQALMPRRRWRNVYLSASLSCKR